MILDWVLLMLRLTNRAVKDDLELLIPCLQVCKHLFKVDLDYSSLPSSADHPCSVPPNPVDTVLSPPHFIEKKWKALEARQRASQ